MQTYAETSVVKQRVFVVYDAEITQQYQHGVMNHDLDAGLSG
ncbi:hypothetical protein [Rheinheimera sp. 4Y26]|nr:hypothetical protein [Rheinheimera sp. 4Y26]MCT6700813.1 hypothetical protein [Rheinheimera sp. 4Y26]